MNSVINVPLVYKDFTIVGSTEQKFASQRCQSRLNLYLTDREHYWPSWKLEIWYGQLFLKRFNFFTYGQSGIIFGTFVV